MALDDALADTYHPLAFDLSLGMEPLERRQIMLAFNEHAVIFLINFSHGGDAYR